MSAITVVAAKIGQCFSDSARAQTFNVVLAEAVTKGQGLYQTTGGVFGLWDMAAAAKDEPRGFALEAGAIGEAISLIKYGPIYGLTLAGNHDSLVYASGSVVGGVDTTGVVSVGRVVALADASKTKVLFVDCREQPVEAGWLALHKVGFMSAGTWGSPVISTEAGETFMELWAKCTGAGHVYGRRVNLQVTNPLATTSNAGRFELDLYPTSGTPAGGAAMHAAAELGADADGISGLLAGLSGSLIMSAATRSPSGTYACLVLQSEIKAGNTPPATTSFIRAADVGAVDLPLFLDLEGIGTPGDGQAYDTNVNTPGADSNCTGYLRVRVPGGTVLGIPIFALS